MAPITLTQFPDTLRCGLSWTDAQSKCGIPCPEGVDAACPIGEHCYRDIPPCSQTPTATLDSSWITGITTASKGTYMSAAAKTLTRTEWESSTISSTASASSFVTEIATINVPHAHVSNATDEGQVFGRCGFTRDDAFTKCGSVCLASTASVSLTLTDTVCPPSQHCFATAVLCAQTDGSSATDAFILLTFTVVVWALFSTMKEQEHNAENEALLDPIPDYILGMGSGAPEYNADGSLKHVKDLRWEPPTTALHKVQHAENLLTPRRHRTSVAAASVVVGAPLFLSSTNSRL
ncbi:hypothetical protein BC830DRAFT_129029 [Chytriomyces sp. MP71]|nr:hypothetical protein BC830DRAFT_129029 [Chytriomyces sp. MP71]